MVFELPENDPHTIRFDDAGVRTNYLEVSQCKHVLFRASFSNEAAPFVYCDIIGSESVDARSRIPFHVHVVHELLFMYAGEGSLELVTSSAGDVKLSQDVSMGSLAFIIKGIKDSIENPGSPPFLITPVGISRYIQCISSSSRAMHDVNDVMGDTSSSIAHCQQSNGSTSSISIVIPTLNEERNIGRTLDVALSNYSNGQDPELIVVDGGSKDHTLKEAKKRGARVLTKNGGRAFQLNEGASVASNDVILFLHADTELPFKYDMHIHTSLLRPDVVAGAFRLRISSQAFGIRLVERVANIRSRMLQRPYGDQGLFLKKQVFRDVGAFPKMPFMEDYEMCRRLARKGRIVIADASVTTSARRWETLGVFKTTVLNQIIVACYHFGVPISRLQRWYRNAYRRALCKNQR